MNYANDDIGPERISDRKPVMSEGIKDSITQYHRDNRDENVGEDESENNLIDTFQTIVVIFIKIFLAAGPFVSTIIAAYRLYANNDDICAVTNYPLFATKIFFMGLVGAQLGLISFVGVKAGVWLRNQQVIFHNLNECWDFYFLVLLCFLNIAGNFYEMFRVCGMLMKFVDSVEIVISVLLVYCVANNNVTRINVESHFSGWWRVFMASICLYNVGMFFLDTANSKKVDDYLYALTITVSVTYRTQIAMFFFNKSWTPVNRILGAAEELVELPQRNRGVRRPLSDAEGTLSSGGYTPPPPDHSLPESKEGSPMHGFV